MEEWGSHSEIERGTIGSPTCVDSPSIVRGPDQSHPFPVIGSLPVTLPRQLSSFCSSLRLSRHSTIHAPILASDFCMVLNSAKAVVVGRIRLIPRAVHNSGSITRWRTNGGVLYTCMILQLMQDSGLEAIPKYMTVRIKYIYAFHAHNTITKPAKPPDRVYCPIFLPARLSYIARPTWHNPRSPLYKCVVVTRYEWWRRRSIPPRQCISWVLLAWPRLYL